MPGSRVANKLADGFGSILLGRLIGANLNATVNTDQVINLIDNPTKYRVRAVAMTNGSINPTTARFAIRDGPLGTGTAIVTSVTPALASASVVQDLTIASTNTTLQPVLFLNLTTAQGAAATVDIYVYGDVLVA